MFHWVIMLRILIGSYQGLLFLRIIRPWHSFLGLDETNNLDIQRAYKTEGKINGLLHPLSGVEVKEFCSVVRESGLILVRRLHRDVSSRPCVAAYDEYRTPKALVRALEAALSPTEYTAMEELSTSSAAVSMNQWPLDVNNVPQCKRCRTDSSEGIAAANQLESLWV